MSKRVAPLAMIKRLLLRLLLVCVVFWGGVSPYSASCRCRSQR